MMLFVGSRERSPRAFSFAVFMLATWEMTIAFTYLFFGVNDVLSAFAARASYLFGTLLAFSVFYFSLVYQDTSEKNSFNTTRKVFVLSAIPITFLYFAKDILALFGKTISETVVTDVYLTPDGYLGWHFGNLDVLFYVLFFALWGLTMGTIYQKYKYQTDLVLKRQAWFMLMVLTVGIVPAGMANAAFPGLGLFAFEWPGLMSALGWVSVMAYSVIKENQMKVKTEYSELLIIGMILLMFIGFFAV
jgi:hypothetical protein